MGAPRRGAPAVRWAAAPVKPEHAADQGSRSSSTGRRRLLYTFTGSLYDRARPARLWTRDGVGVMDDSNALARYLCPQCGHDRGILPAGCNTLCPRCLIPYTETRIGPRSREPE